MISWVRRRKSEPASSRIDPTNTLLQQVHRRWKKKHMRNRLMRKAERNMSLRAVKISKIAHLKKLKRGNNQYNRWFSMRMNLNKSSRMLKPLNRTCSLQVKACSMRLKVWRQRKSNFLKRLSHSFLLSAKWPNKQASRCRPPSPLHMHSQQQAHKNNSRSLQFQLHHNRQRVPDLQSSIHSSLVLHKAVKRHGIL